MSALPMPGGGVIDPTWINAASTVVGKALQPGNVGPSRAESDSGGIFGFSAPFNVTTGSGDAGTGSVLGPALAVVAVVIVGVIAWKLLKKS